MATKKYLYLFIFILLSLSACEITTPDQKAISVITRENASSLTLYTTVGETGNDDIAWSPDGNTLAVASQRGIYLVDLETQEMQRFSTDFTHFSPNDHIIAFSPDGILLAFSDNSINSPGTVKIYDIASHERLFQLDDIEDPDMQTFGIAFSPDGTMLAAGCGTLNWGFGPGSVKFWEVSTGTLIHEYSHDGLGTIYNLAFNPDGSQLAAVSMDGNVYSWDLKTHQLTQAYKATGGIVYGLTFNPDGKILAVASSPSMMDETYTLRLIDLSSGETTLYFQVLEAFSNNPNEGGSIAFNGDGSVLASTCQDGTVRLWDTLTGEQLTVMDVPGAHGVSFSPDGTQLATSGFADPVRLWLVDENGQP